MASGDIVDMEVVLEVEQDEPESISNMTKKAVQLQSRLDQLREQLNNARAQKAALSDTYGASNNAIYNEVSANELHKLTETRTKTFLNFTSLQAVLRATQTNQALSKALELEKDDEKRFEPEELEYVKYLLEKHKDLSESLLKQQEKGTDQEIQIIEARTELAGLLCKYQELRNQAGPVIFSEDEKDKELVVLEKDMAMEDLKINQIRMLTQKLMIGEVKFGQMFDEETNAKFKNMLLRCGMHPGELRKLKLAEIQQ